MKKILSISALCFAFTIANAQNTWLQRANYSGGNRTGTVGFSIGTKGYIALGYDGSSWHNDIW
ncbi:hypothetical protein BH11BAC1_BH11BAC1_24970 [soil metagenome]